ncbi:MAG: hypothetical protein ACO3VO_00250 [Ilumatobacteraceae bacterium]
MANDIGQGTYVTFGTIVGSAATQYKVNSVALGGVSRDVVDASHLLTSGGKEFIGSEYYDPGELTLEIHHDPSLNPVNLLTNVGTAQVCTIIFANGGTSTAKWSAYGFASAFEASAPKDDMMTGSLTIKLSGNLNVG